MPHQRGFTLIELLITVAIVGLLASIALPLSELAIARGKEADLRRALREIRTGLDAYKRASDEGRIQRSPDQSGYPPTLLALVDGVPDAKSVSSANIRFMRRIPRDPFHPDAETAGEATWGLRSYESSHTSPRPGKDVFDVYSLSDKKGLNGVAYANW